MTILHGVFCPSVNATLMVIFVRSYSDPVNPIMTQEDFQAFVMQKALKRR